MRSLAWLVGAAVAGVVGQVVLAASADLDLASVADAVGSRLVEADDEGGRLRAAAAVVRSDPVLVLLAGYAADATLVEELARGASVAARLLAEPTTLVQRLFPARAAMVGALTSVSRLRTARDFDALRHASRSTPVMSARARALA